MYDGNRVIYNSIPYAPTFCFFIDPLNNGSNKPGHSVMRFIMISFLIMISTSVLHPWLSQKLIDCVCVFYRFERFLGEMISMKNHASVFCSAL
jgi:hypothetical protein